MADEATQTTGPTGIKLHFSELHFACGAVLDETFAGTRNAEMAKSHAFVADLAAWLAELQSHSVASVLRAASREYQFALLALAQRQYRAAFSALRLSLELSLAAVQWSTNERELREWKRGVRDCNWTSLIDKENGVLSKNFVRLFAEGLEQEAAQYRGAAEAAFRECSEYVHGNAATSQAIPEHIAFDANLFTVWHAKASVVRLVISFTLCVRFLQTNA